MAGVSRLGNYKSYIHVTHAEYRFTNQLLYIILDI